MEAGTQSPPDGHDQPRMPEPPGVSPQVADQVHRRRAARAERETEREELVSDLGPGAAAVAKLSDERPTVTEDEIHDATDWFLSDEETADDSRELKVNVGSPEAPHRIRWVIRPIDSEVVRRARREAQVGTRAQRRSGVAQTDDTRFNALIVVDGTSEPNLLQIGGGSREAAVEALRSRFKRKPGLIPQISGEIMSLSGYDDEDIQEVEAAGNSSS